MASLNLSVCKMNFYIVRQVWLRNNYQLPKFGFSTFLVKVRPILKSPYSILSKCSTFGSWRKWSYNFWKNSPRLLIMNHKAYLSFTNSFEKIVILKISRFWIFCTVSRFIHTHTHRRPGKIWSCIQVTSGIWFPKATRLYGSNHMCLPRQFWMVSHLPFICKRRFEQ